MQAITAIEEKTPSRDREPEQPYLVRLTRRKTFRPASLAPSAYIRRGTALRSVV